MSKRVLWLLACLALFASCQKLQLFHEMMALRGQIATQFHEARTQVNVVHEGTVVVMFIDSPLNNAPPEEKQKRADEVAAFVMKNAKRPVPEVRTFFMSQARLDRYTGHPAR